MDNQNIPTREELQLRSGKYAGTSWGLFDDPDRGAVSFVDAAAISRGLSAARSGEAFGLDYAVDAFFPGMSKARKAPVQTIYSNHAAHRDDYVDGLYLQGSSQIDGLRHRRADGLGFYNGVADEAITPGSTPLGVQNWADNPIVTRMVVIDVASWMEQHRAPIDHQAGDPIPFRAISGAIEEHEIVLEQGDVAVLHTGWCEWFLHLSESDKASVISNGSSSGIEQSEEFVDWAWNSRLALIAADNFAVERVPAVTYSPFMQSAPSDKGMMHQELLAKLGVPLGELWRVGPLARRMRALGRWEALLTAKPIFLNGGTGSPANATAVL